MVDAKYQVTGIGLTLTGRNGGGDPYYTDGEVWILRLVVACQKRTGPADSHPEPAGDRDQGPDLARDCRGAGEIADAHSVDAEATICLKFVWRSAPLE